MGRAINKAVTIAEILKRKEPLHQITLLTSSEIIDVSTRPSKYLILFYNYSIEINIPACISQSFLLLFVKIYEPLEEGLDIVESKRYVSCMTITLSMTSEGLDVTDIGYQPPLPLEEIQPGDLNTRHASEIGSTTKVI